MSDEKKNEGSEAAELSAEDVALSRRWYLSALVIGYNHIVTKDAKTIAQKTYFRAMRDLAAQRLRDAGGSAVLSDAPTPLLEITLEDAMPEVRFSERDIELMRDAVRRHDAARIGRCTCDDFCEGPCPAHPDPALPFTPSLGPIWAVFGWTGAGDPAPAGTAWTPYAVYLEESQALDHAAELRGGGMKHVMVARYKQDFWRSPLATDFARTAVNLLLWALEGLDSMQACPCCTLGHEPSDQAVHDVHDEDCPLRGYELTKDVEALRAWATRDR